MDEQRLARGVVCEDAAQLWEHRFEVHACVAQVVDAPEVLTIIESMPELSQFLNSLYQCQYYDFFKVCCAAFLVFASLRQHLLLTPESCVLNEQFRHCTRALQSCGAA